MLIPELYSPFSPKRAHAFSVLVMGLLDFVALDVPAADTVARGRQSSDDTPLRSRTPPRPSHCSHGSGGELSRFC